MGVKNGGRILPFSHPNKKKHLGFALTAQPQLPCLPTYSERSLLLNHAQRTPSTEITCRYGKTITAILKIAILALGLKRSV